jgi:hypothetical protein
MKDIDEITAALAKRYAGSLLDDGKKKEEPKPVERLTATDDRDEYFSRPRQSSGSGASFASGGKLFPSERMALRSFSSQVIRPSRPPVMLSQYSDDELDWMLNTPAKRGWTFEDWLEVIGLPRDLHEKHDLSIYGFAARAYLKRKQEAHNS